MWLVSSKGKLYPNLYIMLVAPPGVGKTLMLSLGRGLLSEIGDAASKPHIAPSNISAAGLADALNAATRKIDRVAYDPINPFVNYNSLSVFVPELGSFLPEYDNRMINMLTDMYDCGPYKEAKRGNDLRIDIPAAQLNFMGACTPSYLNGVIPPGAWDQGFMSRVVMAYSGETLIQDIFSEDDAVALPSDLSADLALMLDLYGEFSMEDTYRAAVVDWQRGGCVPLPTHPRLLHYNTRRLAHTLKLSMVASVNRSNELVLRHEDFIQARDWLVEAETDMPEIFKASGLSGDSAIMDDCFHFIFQTYKAEGAQPISAHRIVDYLRRRIAGPQVINIMKVMEGAHMIEKVEVKGQSTVFYKPVPVSHHHQ